MHDRFESRHPLVGFSDELIRLSGRLKSLFAGARTDAGIGDSELTVLNSVVEAERPVTVPQIGRSIGVPRQMIQRAANSLLAARLVETLPNPDHKRAALLRATDRGIAIKRQVDGQADALAGALSQALDLQGITAATSALRTIREQLEDQLRDTNDGRS